MRRGVRQLVERAFAAHASAAQQDEPIADARGVADLVDREEERPPGGGVRAQRGADLARLPQVEPIERLVGQEQRLRRQQADREQRALALPFRERRRSRASSSGARSKRVDHFVARRAAGPPKNPIVKSSAQRTVCAGHGAMPSGT